jgi:hypothetical protein
MGLLENSARQAGAAVYAYQLTHHLQHSRERLVITREEERRRLRPDLHDGLGLQVATLALKVDTARYYLHEDDDSVFSAMRAVTQDYMLKGVQGEEMLRAIRATANGEAIFSPGVTERIQFTGCTNRCSARTIPGRTFRQKMFGRTLIVGRN